MTTLEVLEKALGLIEKEENWCGNTMTGVGPGGSLCAVNAIRTVTDGAKALIGWSDLALEAHRALQKKLGVEAVAAFNDSHTHAEVVALFQQAIRAEKEKAGVSLDFEEKGPVTKEPETKGEVHV